MNRYTISRMRTDQDFPDREFLILESTQFPSWTSNQKEATLFNRDFVFKIVRLLNSLGGIFSYSVFPKGEK